MASKEITEDLQNELTCNICQASLADPVTAPCGHSVCQSCLSDSNESSCHRCKEISQARIFNAILRRRRKLPRKKKKTSQKQKEQGPSNCDRHQEEKKLFCMNDRTLLCVSCSQSQEHENHRVLSVEEAAKVYRKKLQENLELVNESLKDVQKLILEEKKVPRTWAVVWTEQTEMSREMFEDKFLEMSDFLGEEEEEVQSLVELNQEEHEIFEVLIEREAEEVVENLEQKRLSNLQLSQHKNDLREMATALEEKFQMPDKDLLQDAEDILNKSELLLLERPEPFTPRLSEVYCLYLGLLLKKFKASRQLQCRYPYELPDDNRKRTFTFADIDSGRLYAIFTSGSLHYMNLRDLSITQVKLDDISDSDDDDEDPPMFTCYCLPIEKESGDIPSYPKIEWQ